MNVKMGWGIPKEHLFWQSTCSESHLGFMGHMRPTTELYKNIKSTSWNHTFDQRRALSYSILPLFLLSTQLLFAALPFPFSAVCVSTYDYLQLLIRRLLQHQQRVLHEVNGLTVSSKCKVVPFDVESRPWINFRTMEASGRDFSTEVVIGGLTSGHQRKRACVFFLPTS